MRKLAADAAMRKVKGVTLSETDMQFRKIDSWFASSAGSKIHQRRIMSGCGIVATSFKGNGIQKRSYPNSFGGQHILGGYELIESLDLVGNAPRIGEEVVALHAAPLWLAVNGHDEAWSWLPEYRPTRSSRSPGWHLCRLSAVAQESVRLRLGA